MIEAHRLNPVVDEVFPFDPPQPSPSAYEIGFGQLAEAEVYHEIVERWHVTRGRYGLR
jgi:hypothetical protein